MQLSLLEKPVLQHCPEEGWNWLLLSTFILDWLTVLG
jgi:hypothetical protein